MVYFRLFNYTFLVVMKTINTCEVLEYPLFTHIILIFPYKIILKFNSNLFALKKLIAEKYM